GHQGPYNGSGTYGTSNIYANDTWQYSVMSYFSQPNYGGSSYAFLLTPMMADIYAVVGLYGAATTHAGDTVYGFNCTAGAIYDFSAYGTGHAFTITDANGAHTPDASVYASHQTLQLG